MNKYIIVPILIIIVGFTSGIVNYFVIDTPKSVEEKSQPNVLKSISPNLQIMDAADLKFGEKSNTLNFIDLLVFFCLVIGIIQFLDTDGREIRLLGFSVSILLIGSITALIFNLIAPVTKPDNFSYEILNYRETILSVGFRVFWIILSYVTLNEINKTRIFDCTLLKGSDILDTESNFKEANKSDRVIGYLVDTFFALVICGKIVLVIIGTGLLIMERSGLATISVIIILLSSLFIYNIFFEKLFAASPGKFLTSCKIVSLSTKELTINQITQRTIAKLFPKKIFSSTVFEHDQNIKIKVVKECRN